MYNQTIFQHVSMADTAIMRKSTSVDQNTAVVSCLYYAHTDSLCIPINTELAEMHPVLMGMQSESVCMIRQDRQAAYNSDVLVRRGGLLWQWLCPPLKHDGIQFDCIQNFLNCYVCILLVQFLNNSFSLHICLSGPPLHAASSTYSGPVDCMAASLCISQ